MFNKFLLKKQLSLTNSNKSNFHHFIQNIQITFVILYILIQIKTEKVPKYPISNNNPLTKILSINYQRVTRRISESGWRNNVINKSTKAKKKKKKKKKARPKHLILFRRYIDRARERERNELEGEDKSWALSVEDRAAEIADTSGKYRYR